MANQFNGRVLQGMEVWSADGHKLGKVVRTTGNDFWVEKGFFFPKEYQIACADITDVSGDRIELSLRRDELGMERGVAESLGFGKHEEAPLRSASRLEGQEEIRVPVHEEEVTARKHTEQVGEVRIHKEVVTEEKQISVPVSREVVTIERIAATGQPAASGEAFAEQTISVPIRADVVDIEKQTVVREEIRVSKDQVESQAPVSTTVRREVAEVEQTGTTEDELPRRKTGTFG
jgi:uncharacterized protein (TIGR02271 family)